MEYALYKMVFPVGLHIGQKTLEHSDFIVKADTLFSALYIEALKRGDTFADGWEQNFMDGKLCLSDAMPFANDDIYVPKPLCAITTKRQDNDSTEKKFHKNLRFLPVADLPSYLSGTLTKESYHGVTDFGTSIQKTNVAIRGEEESRPYRTGVFYFHDTCGLAVLVGYADAEGLQQTEELLEALSFVGIGGRRASGLGRFDLYKKPVPSELNAYLNGQGAVYMTIAGALPDTDELEEVIEDAEYLLEKRGGFVFSETYAPSQMRKKDVFLFAAGSCFKKPFAGGIVDVSSGGSHPVYRYAIPLFLRFDV